MSITTTAPITHQRYGRCVVYQEDDATVWDWTDEANEWADAHRLPSGPESPATFEVVTTNSDGDPIWDAA